MIALDSLREPLECSIEAHCLESNDQVYIGKDSNGREIRSLKNPVLTPCLHVFCQKDLADAMRNRSWGQCPICRADIDEDDLSVISDFAESHFKAITKPTRAEQDRALRALYSDDQGQLLAWRECLKKTLPEPSTLEIILEQICRVLGVFDDCIEALIANDVLYGVLGGCVVIGCLLILAAWPELTCYILLLSLEIISEIIS